MDSTHRWLLYSREHLPMDVSDPTKAHIKARVIDSALQYSVLESIFNSRRRSRVHRR